MTRSARPQNSTTVRARKDLTFALPPVAKAARLGLRVVAPHAPSLATRMAEELFLTARRHRRPAWEEAVLATAVRTRVRHAGSWLPVWTWGEPGAATILLVHGWEGRGSHLGAFVDPLVRAGFRVVAFDAPGHGDAPMRHASAVEHARGIVSVAERFGPLHAVVGHSVGAAATLLATRFGLEAEAFALIAPPVSPRRFADGFARIFDLSDGIKNGMLARRYGMAVKDIDAAVDAGRVRRPMLVIHDADDKVVPFRDGASIAGAAPDAELVETHGLGHARILRAPEVVDLVARFVTRTAPRVRSFVETLEGELFDRERRRAS
jgi:pimeloyl-ACP methyl ester carboxylesterase